MSASLLALLQILLCILKFWCNKICILSIWADHNKQMGLILYIAGDELKYLQVPNLTRGWVMWPGKLDWIALPTPLLENSVLFLSFFSKFPNDFYEVINTGGVTANPSNPSLLCSITLVTLASRVQNCAGSAYFHSNEPAYPSLQYHSQH